MGDENVTRGGGPSADEMGELAGGVRRDLVELCTDRGLSVAAAESLTAGLVCAGIADVPGASAVLRGGAVTYATEAKAAVLGVDSPLLAARGAVDPDVAQAMAAGARRLFDADLAVATTGVAGPSEQDGNVVGTCYVALCVPGCRAGEPGHGEQDRHSERCDVKALMLEGDRDSIRTQCAEQAWRLVVGYASEH